MKQCIPIVEEEYDGELRFSIIETEFEKNFCRLTLGAKDGEELIGCKITVPLLTRKFGFKVFRMIPPQGTVKFSSIGEKSDRMIVSLNKFYQPAYDPGEAFSDEEVAIDYVLRNQGAYDLDRDKIYLKLFYDEDQDEGIPAAERVHLNMNFAFNLGREVASLIETKEGYTADLLTFLMK
ncbi:MAG: hypothetical protein IJD09_01095 [Clostridia bacterium]|nr:hypothetical protein [Clostridia bacterium]